MHDGKHYHNGVNAEIVYRNRICCTIDTAFQNKIGKEKRKIICLFTQYKCYLLKIDQYLMTIISAYDNYNYPQLHTKPINMIFLN